MTEPAIDPTSTDQLPSSTVVPERVLVGKRSWTRWLVAISVIAAVGWFLLYANFDRPIRDVIDVLDYSSTEGFGPLGQEADWNFAATADPQGRVITIALEGIGDAPVQFHAQPRPESIFAARLTDSVWRLNDDEILAIYYGAGCLAKSDGHQRALHLLEPAGLISKSATVADATLIDRTLAILIRGRLEGRQRGTLVTYEIPPVDWGNDSGESLAITPTISRRVDEPFLDAKFIPRTQDWVQLTRNQRLRFSWGQELKAPDGAKRLWARNAKTIIVHTSSNDAVAFHELDLQQQPLEVSRDKVTLSPLKHATGNVEISPHGRYALVMRNVFADSNTFGLYRSNASTDFTLISLDDWTIRASSRESSQAWRSTAWNPYWQAAFTHDSQHLRLLRSSQQLEIVDINAWIRSCGNDP